MRYDKTTKTIVAICLAILLFGLTVGYAVLSRNLTISGTGTVNNAGWDIHFANVEASATGTATFTEPTIDSTTKTTLENYSVDLLNPSDTVTFTFDVVNDGGIDAVIESTTLDSIVPECKSPTYISGQESKESSTQATSNTAFCENLDISLTYDTGGAKVQANDELKAHTTKTMKLTFKLKSTTTNIPKDDVKATNLDFSIIYVQDDSDLKN